MQKRKPKEFAYKPRFYDPEKEALQERIKNRLESDDFELVKMRIRREFSSNRRKKPGLFAPSSSFRIILIIMLLLVFSYIVLENLLPQLMESWFPELEEKEVEFY